MKKTIILLFIILLVFSLVACKKEVTKEYYYKPSVSKIEGTLTIRMYYGPPGYGENPDTDFPLYPFVLQLDGPIDVIALEDDIHNSDKFQVTEIQVVPSNEVETEILKQYLNKTIVVEGTLFEAFLGHAHHTDVVLDIENILNQ